MGKWSTNTILYLNISSNMYIIPVVEIFNIWYSREYRIYIGVISKFYKIYTFSPYT